MNRLSRKLVADQTVRILKTGEYTGPSGAKVSIKDDLDQCVRGTMLIRPQDFSKLSMPPSNVFETQIDVVNQTTFAGAQDLIALGGDDVCSLNFASAKNPGGGFLNGSQAQEEALARASGLYASLITAGDYYDYHRSQKSALYSDHMIYSPQVPVFRDDDDQFLDQPWKTSIITSPAVNAGVLRKQNPKDSDRVLSLMEKRSECVLMLAASRGHKDLVLGAWGCGVFRNDPVDIAEIFKRLLAIRFNGVFRRVRFSVLDFAADLRTFSAFQKTFKEATA